MHPLHSSVAMLTLLGSVRCQGPDPTPAPVQAKARVTAGHLHLFSGEDVQLTCSVPGDLLSSWRYRWFLNGVLVSSTSVYNLQNAQVLQTGNYTCHGEREIETWPYLVTSRHSDLLNVHVDGGWVLLQTLTEPLVTEETLTLTCRVRDDPLLVEVTFYKGDVLIQKQNGKDLVIPSVTLGDQGTYWCKATWVQRFQYHSAQSLKVFVTVLDKLASPVLEVESGQASATEGSTVILKCYTQLNTREKGHTIDYYFMKDGTRLGPSTSQDTHALQRVGQHDSGNYTCRAKVRVLSLARGSNVLAVEVRPRN